MGKRRFCMVCGGDIPTQGRNGTCDWRCVRCTKERQRKKRRHIRMTGSVRRNRNG